MNFNFLSCTRSIALMHFRVDLIESDTTWIWRVAKICWLFSIENTFSMQRGSKNFYQSMPSGKTTKFYFFATAFCTGKTIFILHNLHNAVSYSMYFLRNYTRINFLYNLHNAVSYSIYFLRNYKQKVFS